MSELFVIHSSRSRTEDMTATAEVMRRHRARYDLRLVGDELPGGPAPIPLRMARVLSARRPRGRPFGIWHLRHRSELRAAVWSRDVLRLPIRLVFSSGVQDPHPALARWLIARMDAVVATSEAAADLLPHVRAVIPHGVDLGRFCPAADRAAAWAAHEAGGNRAVATVGPVRPESGTDLFVDAMLRVLPDLPDTVALVLGRAEDEGYLEGLQRKVDAAGMAHRIRFPGEAPADRLPGILRSLSLVVQMPRDPGPGKVSPEALASGVPFIASDTDFHRALADRSRAGLTVADHDASAAADALRCLLPDQDRLEAMALAARKIAETDFSFDLEAAGIASVYEDIWSDK